MNSADLLHLRLQAAARNSERLDALLQTISLLPSNINKELEQLGWSDSDRLGAISLLLSKLQGELAEQILS